MFPIDSQILSDQSLFSGDFMAQSSMLDEQICGARVLVLGGAGSIGQQVVKALLAFKPRTVDIVDLSENNLAELVRDIRSGYSNITSELRFYALDIGSREFGIFANNTKPYDYIFNLSALKHVRSEKDVYTLMRMFQVNVVNTFRSLEQLRHSGLKRYFSVSTDKASLPVNMMGASKRLMEYTLYHYSDAVPVSSARFANVAFSDGSLLHSFDMRLKKQQPIVAPHDIRRYFMSGLDAAQLCLISAVSARSGDVYIPKLNEQCDVYPLSEVAEQFVINRGYTPFMCETEEQARELAITLPQQGQWPCFFTGSDTTGEKDVEVFSSDTETLDLNRFEHIAVVTNKPEGCSSRLECFLEELNVLALAPEWEKEHFSDMVKRAVPEFEYIDRGKSLDEKM